MSDAQNESPSIRDISVGDRVRVVRLPTRELPEETLALYRHLIESGVVLTVYPFVRPPDRPFVHHAWVKLDGSVEMCDLYLEGDTWARTDDHATPSSLPALRNIHVGDMVRLVSVPDDECPYEEEEEALYRKLVREQALLQVTWIDDCDGEQLQVTWVADDSQTENIFLAMADPAWERVDEPA